MFRELKEHDVHFLAVDMKIELVAEIDLQVGSLGYSLVVQNQGGDQHGLVWVQVIRHDHAQIPQRLATALTCVL